MVSNGWRDKFVLKFEPNQKGKDDLKELTGRDVISFNSPCNDEEIIEYIDITVKKMEDYHEKNKYEFTKYHIKNYVHRQLSYIGSDIWKEYFKDKEKFKD